MTVLREAEGAVDPEERPVPQLKHRVFRAGSWTLVGHFLSLSLRFVSSLILTRIFSPDTFGLLAIITAISTVVGLLTDIGLRPAIVQSRNGATPIFLNTAWSVHILRGVLVWCLCVIAAAGLYVLSVLRVLPQDSVYAQPILPTLIIVSSFSSVILGFLSMKTISASRELNLGRVTLIDIFSQLGGLVIVVTLGWLTRSIWSYIGGLMLTTCITVVLGHVWLQGPRDRLAWDKDSLRELSHFGRWVFLSSAISATILNGDRILLAAWLSPATLGFYSIANNLAGVPDALANRLFASVAMPTLSEINRNQPARFSSLFSRMRWLLDSLLLFMAGFLFASGAAIIGLLYDPRYVSAGWMLQWLSFSLVFARYNIAGNAYLALGRPYYVTLVNVVRSVSLFVFLATGFHFFGVAGAIVGIAFHMFPSTLCMLYFNHRLRINNFSLELLVLLSWAAGWLVGKGLEALIVIIKPYLVG